MSFIDLTRSIERQRFFDGQRLFADDLQQIEGFNREMRWLHNQSLHQPGIGNGFAVSGRKGDREVVVGAGYAIDDLGREIVLTTTRTLPVPPVAGDVDGSARRYVLTIRYPGDENLEQVERRQGVCTDGGAVRLREEPIFCWVPLNADGSPARDQADIVSGRSPVLTEVAVKNCRLDQDLSIVQRRNARPAGMPQIACGVARPTQWRTWSPWSSGTPDVPPLGATFHVIGGIQADIDTQAGGFLATPGYFARIDGPRYLEIDDGEGGGGGEIPIEEGGQHKRPIVLDGLLSVQNPGPGGFLAQVLVLQFGVDDLDASPPEPVEPPGIELPELLTDVWEVGWMGFEA